MPGSVDVRVLLARRPPSAGASAFGHVNVSPAGRVRLEAVLRTLGRRYVARKEVPFHPDDEAEEGEVLVGPLSGFDNYFQPHAPWSLERTVAEIRKPQLPATLNAAEVAGGGWTFYAIRTPAGISDIVVIRARPPSFGLKSESKLVTAFMGNELKPVEDPLVAFDQEADAVVVGQKVYVVSPRRLERLLIDADAVKARAPQTAAAFQSQMGAPLAAATVSAIESACSRNANVARRVERLVREGGLSNVTAAKVRDALPNAGLQRTDLGASGALVAHSDERARVLIDIAADLYYQPIFDSHPRRVASYRRLA